MDEEATSAGVDVQPLLLLAEPTECDVRSYAMPYDARQRPVTTRLRLQAGHSIRLWGPLSRNLLQVSFYLAFSQHLTPVVPKARHARLAFVAYRVKYIIDYWPSPCLAFPFALEMPGQGVAGQGRAGQLAGRPV